MKMSMGMGIPSKTIIISISLLGLGLGIGYQQHLRLIRLYPHIDAPPLSTYTNLISSDKGPTSSERWGKTDLTKGHIWQLDIPRKFLQTKQTNTNTNTKQSKVKVKVKEEEEEEEEEEEMLVKSFMSSYWNSAPLILEGFLVGQFAKLGILKPFVNVNQSKTQTQIQGQDPFARGNTLVGGAFIVENDLPLLSLTNTNTSDSCMISGPILCRWGDISGSKPNSIGGYHIFSVDHSPSIPSGLKVEEDELVRVKWTAYWIRPTSNSNSNSNTESEKEPIHMKILLSFHMLYSRILMDCTARNLGLKVSWF